MNVSWAPVIFVDISGSILTLALAFWCAVLSREWTQKKPDDIFRHYIFLLTLAIVFFAISRSFGHLVKQILLLSDLESSWELISPFSGAINSTSFVVIFAFGIYFHRFQKVHLEIERYKHHLEETVDKRTAELKETNLTLETVLNSSIPICITSVNFDLLKANNAYYSIWPLGEEASNNLKCFESRPGSFCHRDQCPLSQIVNGKEEVVLEVSKDTLEIERQFIVTAKPFRDVDGKLVGIVESFQDISDRKKAEIELASERERLAVTLRSIGDGVITTDISGNIVLINKIAEEFTGWSPEDAVGKPLEDVFKIINEKTKNKCENPATKALKTGKIITLVNHTALISKDGSIRSIADSGAPIRDEKSEIIGAVLVFRDVTNQQRMEEELLKVKKLESVGVLAGGIAHDFNNILTAILGNINLARLDTSMKDQTQHLLAEAEKASLRAKKLTQQLLTFSKGGEPVKKTSSLREVIQDSADFVLHGEKVLCEYCIPDDLLMVDIDKGQFGQVIQNIIINAKHAMPEGGVIKIRCENVDSGVAPQLLGEKAYVQVSISDNGIGIPANIIDKIFDPYFSTKSEGSGLGLAICHSIIKKHKGSLSVKSQPGQGTTFTIILPASTHMKEKQTLKPVEIDQIAKAKIMVMDDEKIVRDVAHAMLSGLGHDVVLAKDGAEAIQLFKESVESGNPIDLTIMDLTIPGGMGGKEAVKQLININPEAKVIVSSGYSNDPIMANCKEYGFCASVVKPYRSQDLNRVIAQVLSD